MDLQQIQDNKCNCQTLLLLSVSQRIKLNITTGNDKPIQVTDLTSAFNLLNAKLNPSSKSQLAKFFRVGI